MLRIQLHYIMTLLTMATDVDLSVANITTSLPGVNNNKIWGNNVTIKPGEQTAFSNSTTANGLIEWNGTTQSLVEFKADPEWAWLATLVLILLALGVNAALLGVTCRSQQLHTTLHALLASLAVIDILNALFVMPFAINAAIHGEYTSSKGNATPPIPLNVECSSSICLVFVECQLIVRRMPLNGHSMNTYDLM